MSGIRNVHTGERLINPHNRADDIDAYIKCLYENMSTVLSVVNKEVEKGGIIKHEDGTYEITDNCGPLPRLC